MNRTKEKKRLPVSLEAQIKAIVKDHMAEALKESKTRRNRNGQGAPLMAWMKGAPKSCASKISAVCSGSARFPYVHWGAATLELAKRIGRRYGVTWVQQSLITEYCFLRHAGRWNESQLPWIGLVTDDQISGGNSFLCEDAIRAVCRKLRITTTQIPLRALIDERMTNILLLIQLQDVIQQSRKTLTRANKCKQIN